MNFRHACSAVVLSILGISIGGAAGAGCGGSDGSHFIDDDAGAGNDGSTGDNDGGGGLDGAVFGNDTGTKPGCDTHCSSDLHAVLDCDNHVIKTCPSDQGCAAGSCVPACDSAKANKSTIGCDYFDIDMGAFSEGAGSCFAAFIANTWTSPVTITVDFQGQTLNLAGMARIPSGSGQSLTYAPLPNNQLPAGQVAILFLAQFGSGGLSYACPAGVTPGFTTANASLTTTGLFSAFHITTSAPVVAYDIFPYGGGNSALTAATLLLPTSAWDTNYIGVNAFRKSAIAGAEAQPMLDIVAQEDGTTVTISPTSAIVGGSGVAPTGAGVPMTYNLSKGQVIQFKQDAELSGSPIQSNKPIGVWGGASCMNIDVSDYACDSAHQQIPPVKALGHEYVAVRYRNRIDGQEESPPWRIIGAVDGTTLTYEPSAPAGAPATLKLGQVAEFKAAGPFVVKSQDDKHPFYMSGHMTGGTATSGIGDPEFVNVIPPQEYLASYVFFTDPTYPETNLVLVRTKAKDGFHDVTLDCAGVLTGWQPLGSSGSYEYTRTDLVRHNFAKQGTCDNGRHEIHSDAPFGLTVWGWGSSESTGFFSEYVSYAYPAGASVQPINTVVIPPTPR